jgi:hypothetical protein
LEKEWQELIEEGVQELQEFRSFRIFVVRTETGGLTSMFSSVTR